MTAAEFATLVKGAKPRSDRTWWDAQCPAHDDRRASLSFTDGEYELVVKCHAGCSREQIAHAVGRTVADFSHASSASRPARRCIVCTYDYVDETGRLLYQKVRYEPKDFRLRRPDPTRPGTWIYNLDKVRRVLYRLDELAEQERVFYCEGCKDANRLHDDLGLVATTAGSASEWRAEFAPVLARLGTRSLIVLPHNDPAGETLAHTVARDCTAAGITVTIVRLPDRPPHGGDVSDWLDAGGDRETLDALVAATPLYVPEDETAEAEAQEKTPGPTILIGSAITTAVVTDPDWIIEALFSHQHQHLIVGDSEGAKSWALFDLAMAVGFPSIATYLGQAVRRHGRVCIESWEQGQAEDLRRLHKLARGHGLTGFEPVILISDTPGTLGEQDYFDLRFRELREWGVVLYVVDSLSEAAGIELNDNSTYTTWWRTRIRPILDAGIMVVATHLTGHIKPGIGRTREAVVRNATQIRALAFGVLECRRVGDTTFKLLHNKHRDSTGLPFGLLELAGAMSDAWVRLDLRAEAPRVPPATKEAQARQYLIDLGRAKPETWLDRKAIEQALNGDKVPENKRVSKRSWEPALDMLTDEQVFETKKRGNADVWRWVAPRKDAPNQSDDAPDDDATDF